MADIDPQAMFKGIAIGATFTAIAAIVCLILLRLIASLRK